MSLGKMFSGLLAQHRERGREAAERNEVHARIGRFLNKIGFAKLSPKEKIQRIKQMEYGDFFGLLSTLNGELNSLPRNRYPDQDRGSRPPWVKDSNGTIQYFVPKNGEELFQEFFSGMKSNINVKNCHRYAVKLEYALAFAHIFHDANGRTARYARRLLGGAKPNEADIQSKSNSLSPSGPELANRLAVYELFRETLPQKDQTYFESARIRQPDDVLQFVFPINSDDIAAYGYAFALRGLAYRLAIPDVDILDYLVSRGEFQKFMHHDPEGAARYRANYAELQNKLFWKVQDIIDRAKEPERFETEVRDQIADLSRASSSL